MEAWTGTMVPMKTTEEIRRIIRELLTRTNRPASFERTQTLIRGAATAVRRNINRQMVSSMI